MENMEQIKAKPNGCKINVKLIPLKMAYFFLLAAYAALLPYLPVFMGVLKLTPIEMAIILGVGTAVSTPIRITVGYMADRLQKREIVFAAICLLTLLFHFSLYFIPVKESLSQTNNHRFCSNETFNETLFSVKNISNGLNWTELRCCLDDLKNTSICFDKALNNSGKAISNNEPAINNISIVEHFNSSLNLQSENGTHCIDLRLCNKTTFGESMNHKTFWTFCILNLFAQGTCSPSMNILDSLIYSSLTNNGNQKEFGKTSLWGTVGYGVFALLSGIIQDSLSDRGWTGKYTYVCSFINFAIGMFLSAILTLLTNVDIKLTNTSSGQNKIEKPSSKLQKDLINNLESGRKFFKDGTNFKIQTPESKRDLMRILCGFYLSIVIMTGMIFGMLAGCLEAFFYYFLASLDPNNKSILGVCLAVSCICEAIVLFLSGRILAVLGSKRCLYFVLVVFSIRFLASSYIEKPWYGVIVESMQCICFGLLYPVMTSWANSLVPVHLQSTVQCYLGAVNYSLGRAAGAGIGGVLYEKFGPRVMFRIFAAMSGGYLAVLIFIFEVLDRIRLRKVHKGDDKVCTPIVVQRRAP